MRRTLLVTLAVAGLALTACGGGDNDTAPDIKSLGEKINCQQFDQSSGNTLGAREAASCDVLGESLSLATFNDNKQRDQWLAVAQSFGGVYVVGDRWAISAETQDTASEIARRAGGKVR